MPRSKYLLACDPGKASGFVVLDISDFESQGPVIVSAEEYDQQTTCAYLHWWIANHDDIEIVMEDFITTTATAKKSNNDTRIPNEIIGVGRYFAALYGKPFTLQKPAAAKNFVDNQRIRDLGLWVKGGEGHHKDAMRHAILYLVQSKKWSSEGLLGS